MNNTEEPIIKIRPCASTSQILGKMNGVKVNPKWREAHGTLLARRKTLVESKNELTDSAKQDHTSAFSMHMADAATDQYETDFALSMASSEQNAIYEIEQALNRIRNGTYGVCEMTGTEIEAERLEAI